MIKRYLILRGLEGGFWSFVWTFHIIFHIKAVGLPPEWLVLMGTLYEISILTCEVPTGVVADLVSRRLSVAIGLALVGCAFILEGLLPFLIPVAVAQIVLGIGETFISGAREAWITDEIAHSENPNAVPGEIFARGAQVDMVSRVVGSWAAVPVVGYLGLGAVMIAGGACFLVLSIYARYGLSEKGFHRGDHERHFWASFREGWKYVRMRTVLVAILLVSIIYGLASEGFDRLSHQSILERFELPPLAWLPTDSWWAIFASGSLLAAACALAVLRRVIDFRDAAQLSRMLLILTLLVVGGVAAFSQMMVFAGVVGVFVFTRTMRRCIGPMLTAWINLYAPANQRATILSFEGQAHSFGEIFGGLTASGIARAFGTRWAILASAVMLIPAIPLLVRARAAARDHLD